MAKYFNKIKNFNDLKEKYRNLIRANHPDNGGDAEKMKEINVEYDALFPIWKNRHETATGEKVAETADSTRSRFYTDLGWEGRNHDWNRSLKEVAQIVRTYVKEKYPTYKFSVRTTYASMCQELLVDLKESPVEIYKTYEELSESDREKLLDKFRYNHYWRLDSWTPEEERAEFERIWQEHGNFYKCLNEVTESVIADVDAFVKSYNYSDCDGMIDYFDVDFYYFGCAQNNGQNIRIVPKTTRIKQRKNEPAAAPDKDGHTKPEGIEKKGDYTFMISTGEDTRDGSALWIVRIRQTLSKEDFARVSRVMKEIGGYYSRFKHGFLFRFDPAAALKDAV